LPNDPADEEEPGAGNSEFHFDALERVAKKLSTALRRVSPSRYESSDATVRVVGVNSKAYEWPGGKSRYWYGISQIQRDFLQQSSQAWIAFECESPDKIALFSLLEFESYFDLLRQTIGKHWHVELFENDGALELSLPRAARRVDVSKSVLRDDL
jgi:hypothetical protein